MRSEYEQTDNGGQSDSRYDVIRKFILLQFFHTQSKIIFHKIDNICQKYPSITLHNNDNEIGYRYELCISFVSHRSSREYIFYYQCSNDVKKC